MKLRDGEFNLIATLIKDLTGVHLDASKGYLIASRLGPIAESVGCANLNELYFKLRYDNDSLLTQRVVDAITTHETLWFRDGTPFEALKYKAIPESIDARSKSGRPRQLRIWSAACSTGQEPYGIAMVLREMIPDIDDWDIQILATDISKSSIETAEKAEYSTHDLTRTQRQDMKRWFEEVAGGAKVKESVRKFVRFRCLNLAGLLGGIGPFDIVMLRNVLIYFDVPTKKKILERVAEVMAPHGWLFVGASESLLDTFPQWPAESHCGATVYRPNARVHA